LQGGFLCHRNGVKRIRNMRPGSDRETLEIENDVHYLINPGSVGQPRDGDPRAAYLVYEPEARLVIFYRAPYDVAAAQKKIIGAGLPDLLAVRLAAGL
jgi:diadenosine tetraphosphatase ApaH/serine/threonine PP2A family protein phosphatase